MSEYGEHDGEGGRLEASPLLLHIIAGPNGAGKSTLARALSQRGGLLENVPVVNPDVIAREAQPERPDEAAFEAAREALRRTAALLRERRSFAIETTLAGHRGLRLIREAGQRGFNARLTYVGLCDADLAIWRVEQRVRAGGHFVPAEAVRRRYERSKKNLSEAIPLVDSAAIYDNSADELRLIMETGEQGVVQWAVSATLPEWIVETFGGVPSLGKPLLE